MSSFLDLLPDDVAGAAASETVFWSGAGISADAPTCAPVGLALVDRALGHAFLPETIAVVADAYRRLRLARARPRLETVLGVVERIHGSAVLDDLLSDLPAPPNASHGFFASHLLAGGSHVTANFDLCIERAAPPSGPPVNVVHFHGSFAGAELGATLARIERGFPRDIREQLESVLLAPDKRLIVFVGYSGSDFFDVDPFLASLEAGALAGRHAVWISHAPGTATVAPPGRRQLGCLAAAGAVVSEVSIATRDALAALGRGWGIALPPLPGGTRAPWRPRLPVDAAARRSATVELCALMGLHREVDRLIQDPRGPREYELLAGTRWAEGRYRDAGRAWARARAGASAPERLERAAATFWIRGQYRRARRLLVQALRQHEGSVEDRLLLGETLARVYAHMRRYPDSRLFATERLRRFALAHLPDPDELAVAGAPLGTHLRTRVRSARAGLGAGAAQDDEAIVSFGEYEALGAQLNYRQGRLRARRRRAHVPARELEQLRCDFATIGASGDAARATLLGGPAAFGWADVRWALRELDVTPWHRLRLLAAAVLQRSPRR